MAAREDNILIHDKEYQIFRNLFDNKSMKKSMQIIFKYPF